MKADFVILFAVTAMVLVFSVYIGCFERRGGGAHSPVCEFHSYSRESAVVQYSQSSRGLVNDITTKYSR